MRCFNVAKYFFYSFFLFLASCNYNYYLGLQLEEKELYEEANIEYQRAYIQDPYQQEFKEKFLFTAKKTSQNLLQRYYKKLQQKEYFNAYQLLRRTVTLTPNEKNVQEELKKWQQVLIAGRINLQFVSFPYKIGKIEKVNFIIQFNTPFTQRKISAIVHPTTGIFYVEDVLYNPTDSLYLFYSINRIGIERVLPETVSFISDENIDFIRFKTPVLNSSSGSLQHKLQKSIFLTVDTVEKFLQKQENLPLWFPPSNIEYQVLLNPDGVKVDSAVERGEFLPQQIFFSSRYNTVFLNFGAYEVKYIEDKSIWGINRTYNDTSSFIQELYKYFLLYKYFVDIDSAYPILLDH